MKKCNKFLALLVFIFCAISLCIPASAATSLSDRSEVVITNEDAEQAFQEFLDAVSFIADDPTWSEDWNSCLNQYGEGSINGASYSKWYAECVDGGSVEEYYSLSSFEQFVWTRTYTSLAHAASGSGDYDKYFGSREGFNMYIVRNATGIMSGNNSDVVIAAYEKLMDWQYDYIVSQGHGVPYNFINNRNYIEELAGSVPIPEASDSVTGDKSLVDSSTNIFETTTEEFLENQYAENITPVDKNASKESVGAKDDYTNIIVMVTFIVVAIRLAVVIKKRNAQNADIDLKK